MERNSIPTICLNSGALIPSFGGGTYRITKSGINAALECGYRHFDTAYIYQVESSIGEVLKEWLSSGRIKRQDLFITSKLPPIGNREADVEKFLKYSLRALGLDYVDLYLVHSPFSLKSPDDVTLYPRDEEGKLIWDRMDIEGVWKAMERQVDAGFAKSIGISNFNSGQTLRLVKSARITPSVNQVEAHLYFQQQELKEVCEQHGIKIIAYNPIGAPYKEERQGIHQIFEDPILTKIAQEKGKTPAQVALKYLLQLGFIVIPKSNTPSRIKENVQLWDFQLNDEELSALKSLDRKSKGRITNFQKIYTGCLESNEYPF